MATELETIEAGNNENVSVASVHGGSHRGRLLQLTQRHGAIQRSGMFFGSVQMTEEQVREAVALMTEWLER